MTTETPTADPMEAVATSLGELVSGIREHNEAMLGEIRSLVRPAGDGGGELQDDEQTRQERERARGRGTDPSDHMEDPIVSGWVSDFYRHLPADAQRRAVRADFELMSMIAGGARQVKNPVELNYSERVLQPMRHFMFEARGLPKLQVLDAKGNVVRAMDTAETGFGLELVGAQYITEMWEAARNLDTLVEDIRSIPMAHPTVYVPINGEIPEMTFVAENTAYATDGSNKYASAKTPSNRVSMAAKKFTIQSVWSGELEEDSIVSFTPFLREMLNISAAQHLGSAYYNGDTTNAGTGNINSDDADPGDTKHYLAWDGIRHDWLVTTTANGINQAAALDVGNINVARGRLSGVDDDIDAALKTINWGKNPRDLRIVCDWDTYLNLLDSDKVVTVDKYAAGATILTGELGSIYGIPIISPSYASKTEADGKASGTEASNTKGQLTVFAPRAYLGGMRRGVQMFMDRIQGSDQFLLELYTRRAFTRFGTNGAAGIYNISV